MNKVYLRNRFNVVGYLKADTSYSLDINDSIEDVTPALSQRYTSANLNNWEVFGVDYSRLENSLSCSGDIEVSLICDRTASIDDIMKSMTFTCLWSEEVKEALSSYVVSVGDWEVIDAT